MTASLVREREGAHTLKPHTGHHWGLDVDRPVGITAQVSQWLERVVPAFVFRDLPTLQ